MGAKSDPTAIGAVHQAVPGDGSGSIVIEGTASGRAVSGFVDWTDGTGLQVKEVECAPAVLALAQKAGAIATGTVVLGGSNPTVVVTGLNTVLGGFACSQQATAPGLDPVIFTCTPDATPGSLDIQAWKFTGAGNPTLIASTNNAVTVAWFAFGT
jgi:hypothetical protein